MMSMMQKNKMTVKSGQQMQSIFFRDLTTPVSSSARGKFTNPGQAAAISALWRDNFGGSGPPPPPVFTLNDRPPDFSPDSPEYATLLMVGNSPSDPLTDPLSSFALKNRTNEAAMTHYSTNHLDQQQHSPSSLQWWTPVNAGSPSIKNNITSSTPTTSTNAAIGVNSQIRKGSVSPVFDAVVHQPDALITVPQPREVARPDTQKSSLPNAHLGEETWVTLYGFSPEDTNLVLREFEKCGTILRHIAGPINSNWVHILFQTRYDAQKALSKNGTQINGLLIIGVKHLDPSQHQYLDEMSNSNGLGFMLPPAPNGGASAPSVLRVSPCPLHLQKVGDNNNQPSVSAIASPAKSTVSKIMDLMFGL